MALPGFSDHPKFRKLVKLLGLPVPYAWGLLECLWSVGYASGNPVVGVADDIELAAQYPGEPGTLFDALLTCKLIDLTEDGRYAIHDLIENAPDYVKARIRMRRQRARAAAAHEGPEHRQEAAIAVVALPRSADVDPGMHKYFAEVLDLAWKYLPASNDEARPLDSLTADALLSLLRAFLREMPYQDYLQTEWWAAVREAALVRAGHRCQLCNASGPALEVHHRTYERRGQEAPEDLIALCRPCHAKFHDKLP